MGANNYPGAAEQAYEEAEASALYEEELFEIEFMAKSAIGKAFVFMENRDACAFGRLAVGICSDTKVEQPDDLASPRLILRLNYDRGVIQLRNCDVMRLDRFIMSLDRAEFDSARVPAVDAQWRYFVEKHLLPLIEDEVQQYNRKAQKKGA